MFIYRLRKMLLLTAVVFASGVAVFKYIEDWSWVDAFYFTGITMVTIGYGDIHPTHDLSKILAVLFGLLSVGLLSYVIGMMIESKFHQKIEGHVKMHVKKHLGDK